MQFVLFRLSVVGDYVSSRQYVVVQSRAFSSVLSYLGLHCSGLARHDMP